MSAVFLHDGATVDFLPAADVAAGSIIVLGDLVGVSKFFVAAGRTGGIAVRGVFDVLKDPSTNIDVGTRLYWSTVSWHVVKTASGHPLLGKSVLPASPGTSYVRVLLTQ
ncbi:DUF2190 family protein [Aporhodopirellula aestuarii]|uniref:DUF2190 family protein n=1 Tax=Aporhodopirellula aestuarii TaxID=2950107 RepID=A0ABT0U1C1_9BACT|nr:DUF2190 family protein [Aporhodopirellula aestuarii]MCM2370679.1 DUF2190 family protein [Aporhodopirellula aestuarii]